MKKTNKILVIFIISIFFASCNKDDELTDSSIQEVQQEAKNILEFNSIEDINSKINFIQTLKNEKENIILDEMFNSKDTTPIDVSEQTELTDELINHVKEYHVRKLENIYEIREELGITSIQSIADEINSLKLINPSKASDLLSEHAEYLKEGKFLVNAITASGISEVINSEGKLLLNNDLKDYSPSKQSGPKSNFVQNVALREGILAINPFYAITWHAGVSYSNEGSTYSIGLTYDFDSGEYSPTGSVIPPSSHYYVPFTKLASLVNIGNGYFIYPSSFNLSDNLVNVATFLVPGEGFTKTIKIPFRGNSTPTPPLIGNNTPAYLPEINTYSTGISLGTRRDHDFYVKSVRIGPASFNTFSDIGWLNPYLNLTSNSLIGNY